MSKVSEGAQKEEGSIRTMCLSYFLAWGLSKSHELGRLPQCPPAHPWAFPLATLAA